MGLFGNESRADEFARNLRERDADRDQHFAATQREQRKYQAGRDWERRNDEHKKSLFYGEIQRARAEGTAPRWQSYLEAPDLEKPRNKDENFGPLGWLVIIVIGLAIVASIGAMVIALVAPVIRFVFVLALIFYVAMTAIWLTRRGLAGDDTAALQAANKWNPYLITANIFRLGKNRFPAWRSRR